METSRAIELLEHLAWDRDTKRNPYGDALNMAIEALKAQTPNTISRQAAIDAKMPAVIGGQAIDVVPVSVIKRLPPAQPKGHWIFVHPLQEDDTGAYMCSECKTGYWEIKPSSYHYCPNCGAKMEVGAKVENATK